MGGCEDCLQLRICGGYVVATLLQMVDGSYRNDCENEEGLLCFKTISFFRYFLCVSIGVMIEKDENVESVIKTTIDGWVPQ